MTNIYSTLASVAQQMGILLFMAAFLLVLIYALAPSRRRRFEDAARIPLKED